MHLVRCLHEDYHDARSLEHNVQYSSLDSLHCLHTKAVC
jgi:hypothetical protein